LKKEQASMGKNTEQKLIKRPNGTITKLQKSMGLENDRALYMNCRVSIYSLLMFRVLITMKGDC
jgi:hypothetical protein